MALNRLLWALRWETTTTPAPFDFRYEFYRRERLLYRNQGNGTLTKYPTPSGVALRPCVGEVGNAFVDLTNDGG